ncbi:MAG: hypothetical protein ACH349_07385 [Candidatus Rhabdochlamydia sp.]
MNKISSISLVSLFSIICTVSAKATDIYSYDYSHSSKSLPVKQQPIEQDYFVFLDFKPNGYHNSSKKEISVPSFKWLDDEVIEINDLKKATETLLDKEGNWLDQRKEAPHMIRYFKKIEEDELPIIQKWLKLNELEYFGVTNTDESPNVDVISSWYEQKEKEDLNLSQEGIYKLIYLNAASTLHKLNFNIGDFSEEWLENHREYHRWNSHYGVSRF